MITASSQDKVVTQKYARTPLLKKNRFNFIGQSATAEFFYIVGKLIHGGYTMQIAAGLLYVSRWIEDDDK